MSTISISAAEKLFDDPVRPSITAAKCGDEYKTPLNKVFNDILCGTVGRSLAQLFNPLGKGDALPPVTAIPGIPMA